MTTPSLRKFVLAPNLIGAALIDPSARRVLEGWRDGQFVAVMNRELIALHLRSLNRIGLPPELIKRWAYWLSAPEKTFFVAKQFEPATLCEDLAKVGKADAIVCWKYPAGRTAEPWVLASSF